jgi:hypothetical protein
MVTYPRRTLVRFPLASETRREAVSTDDDHPNLDALGKPYEALVKLHDGTRAPYPLPQTKADNCADLRRELVDRRPTEEDLARWELTRREYEHFLEKEAGLANGAAPGVVQPSDERPSDGEMQFECHQHRPRTLHALTYVGGIPHEAERTVCSVCGKLIEERSTRRAEA